MSDGYFVPQREAESEFTEKRSRFIGHVCFAEDEASARGYIDAIRKRYYDARHNCWCYVIHEGAVRYGDDGEPQGTAGQPMLNVFQREGVENAVCVVTRYFGGVLLGAGGLTRAYARAAKDALDQSGKARLVRWARMSAAVPYPIFEQFSRLAAMHGGVVEGNEYGADVTATLRMEWERANRFCEAVRELSGGAVAPDELGTVFLPAAEG